MKVSGHFQGQSTPICTTDKDRVVLEPGAQSWAELFRIFWAIVYIFFLVHYEVVKNTSVYLEGEFKTKLYLLQTAELWYDFSIVT